MTTHLVVVIIGLLLLAWVVTSIWAGLRRPAASPIALQRYSLAVGRIMLLVAYIAVTGSAVSVIGVAGAAVAALLVAIVAEHRWPRQTGAVRVAPAVERTLARTVRPIFRSVLAGSALTAVAALVVWWQLTRPVAGSAMAGGTLSIGVRTDLDTSDIVASAPAGSGSTILIGAGAIVFAVAVGGWALRTILGRPTLDGVDTEGDQIFRTVAAERVLRALSAMFLTVAITVLDQLEDALWTLSLRVTGVPDGLAEAFSWIRIGLSAGLLMLYFVGPSRARLRRALPAAARR